MMFICQNDASALPVDKTKWNLQLYGLIISGHTDIKTNRVDLQKIAVLLLISCFMLLQRVKHTYPSSFIIFTTTQSPWAHLATINDCSLITLSMLTFLYFAVLVHNSNWIHNLCNNSGNRYPTLHEVTFVTSPLTAQCWISTHVSSS